MKRLLMALLLCLSISVPGGAQTFDPQALYGTWHIHLDGGPHKDGVIIFAERGPSRARWNDLPGDTFEKNPMGYSLFASPGAWIGVLLRDLDDDVRAYLLIFPPAASGVYPCTLEAYAPPGTTVAKYTGTLTKEGQSAPK